MDKRDLLKRSDAPTNNTLYTYTDADRQTALAQVTGGGMINYNGFQMGKIGLVAPDQFTAQDLDAVGQFLGGISESIQLMIGDLCNYYPKQRHKYEHISEVTGYSVSSLKTFASVANAVQMSYRHDNLKYGHYCEVMTLDPKSQRDALRTASENRWTVKQLTDYLYRTGLRQKKLKPGYSLEDEITRTYHNQIKRAQKLNEDERDLLAKFYRKLAEDIERLE